MGLKRRLVCGPQLPACKTVLPSSTPQSAYAPASMQTHRRKLWLLPPGIWHRKLDWAGRGVAQVPHHQPAISCRGQQLGVVHLRDACGHRLAGEGGTDRFIRLHTGIRQSCKCC